MLRGDSQRATHRIASPSDSDSGGSRNRRSVHEEREAIRTANASVATRQNSPRTQPSPARGRYSGGVTYVTAVGSFKDRRVSICTGIYGWQTRAYHRRGSIPKCSPRYMRPCRSAGRAVSGLRNASTTTNSPDPTACHTGCRKNPRIGFRGRGYLEWRS